MSAVFSCIHKKNNSFQFLLSLFSILITGQVVEAKEKVGFSVSLATNIGLLKGENFSGGLTVGGTLILATTIGFKIRPFDYTVSVGAGSCTTNSENQDGSTTEFTPTFLELGGNLMVANLVFVEGNGFKGFASVTLERLMKNNLNLPFNLLIGSKAFYSTDMDGAGNPSGWAAARVRLDYSL